MFSGKFWFHEDDFGRVQFLPLSCRDFCLCHLDQIRRHDETHRAADGVGWTRMYSIPAAPASVADLSIGTGDLAAAMPWRLRRTNHVLTGGWSDEGTRQPRMAAYLAGPCGIVFGWNENRIIDSLWFKDGYVSRWHRGPLLEAFFRIGILSPMLLVDWRGALVDLGDRKAIRDYLTMFGPASGGHDDMAPVGDGREQESATDDMAKPQSPPGNNRLCRFDCSVRSALVTRKTAGGPVLAILDGGGRYWAISMDDASWCADTPVVPVPVRLDGEAPATDWTDLAGKRVVVWRDYGGRDQADVCDIRDGRIIFSAPESVSVVLSPDGQHLLLFEDDGISVADLNEPTAPVRQSGLFPVGHQDSADAPGRPDMSLDDPGSVMAVASAADAKTFTLAIGDYGFVAVADVRIGGSDEPPLILTEPARMLSEGLVYDPVEIIHVAPGESLFVRHGYGCGITRFDLRTNEAVSCPMPAENPERRYGAFRQAVVSSRPPGIWVRTDAGPCFWNGTGPLKRIPEDASAVLATDGERYLGLSPDGRDLIRGRFSERP